MGKGIIYTVTVVLETILLLTGCELRGETHNASDSIKTPPIISSRSGTSVKTPATIDEPVESSVDIDAKIDRALADAPSKRDVPWNEWGYSAELFVSQKTTGRTEPYETADETRVYERDEPVTIVAFTNTRFFKLSNGDYIYAEHVGTYKIYDPETVKTELSDTPPEKTDGNTGYDRKKALDYAREHWQDEESLCAGFGTECLTAGGLDFDESSSTKLYNKLTAANLGYSVEIDLNKDGTAKVPGYVYPGDLIFYYCKDENMMVHTAVYNGDTKDGLMKAYAHNLPDDGETPFRYLEYCVGGCGCRLDKIVAFCFYRDKERKPTSKPELTAEVNNGRAELSWQPDFVYRNSELVVTDSSGRIIYRRRMGTDKLATVKLGGKCTAYVIFEVDDGVKVRSDNLEFTL